MYVKILDLGAGPINSAQELQRRIDTRVVKETIDRDGMRHLSPTYVLDQILEDRF
jgi:hypothetical protein